MSDTTDRGDKSGGMEEQLRDLLRKANLSFMTMEPEGEGVAVDDKAAQEKQREARLRAIREFKLKPRDVLTYLNRFVVKQDDAKKVLSVAFCDHYNHVRRCLEHPESRDREYAKHNIILLGPTGVGKTYLMRCIAKLIGVPFVKADATKFSETGYVGHDVEDLVRDLVKAANGDTELAQYGIIFVDEVDKIASQSTQGGKDVSGRGVQVNLLKLMEETDVSLFSQTDLLGQMQAIMEMQKGRDAGARTINTRHILFIVSGAFATLAQQVEKRVKSTQIGFVGADEMARDEADYLRLAATRDFVDFGFEPEFIGRLPIRVVCDALSADDLESVMLESEGSILGQYREDFAGYGIAFSLTPDAVHAVASRAHAEQTGARGLMTVLERVFRGFKFELPSTSIRSFEVGRAAVEDPARALDEVLARENDARRAQVQAELDAFCESFAQAHGIRMVFVAEAVDRVGVLCREQGKSVAQVCAERFHDFEYGLKLICRNTGSETFEVSLRLVDEPEQELSSAIALSMQHRVE